MGEIILLGDPGKKRKHSLVSIVSSIFLVYIPIISIIFFVIMLIIDIILGSCREDSFLRGLLGALGDIFSTRSLFGMYLGGEDMSIVASFRENIVEIATRLFASAIFMFLWGIILRSAACPFCGHYFAGHRISDLNYIGESTREVSHKYDEFQDGMAMDMHGNMYMTLNHSEHTQYGTETTTHYNYNVRCGCCGCVYKRQTQKTETSWH